MASSSDSRRCWSARRSASSSPIWRTWVLTSSRSSGMVSGGRLVRVWVGSTPATQRADLAQVSHVGQLDQPQSMASRPFESRDLAVVEPLLEPQVLNRAAHAEHQDGLANGAMGD